MIKALLALRNKLKSKKPTFKTHDSHKKDRVSSTTWRRPKGRQNKQRLGMKGYARGRSTGFGSPVAVKGLSREGLVQNNVATVKEFSTLDAKKDGIIISRTVGNRRRAELLAYAKEKGFNVLNTSVEKFEATQKAKAVVKNKHKKAMSDRKTQHAATAKQAEKDAKVALEQKKKSSSEESTSKKDKSAEEKKSEEKKAHDKILTQKGEQK